MTGLPSTEASLLVRTDFSDDASWERAKAAAARENDDGFRAHLHVVDDVTFDGATWEDLRGSVRALEHHASVLFVADHDALSGEHPIQVVDMSRSARPPFRCVASELWGVDSNLNLANLEWEDFADNVESDGVYRGY